MKKKKLSSVATSDDKEIGQYCADLRNALLSLHKTLVDSERVTYEQTIAPIRSPNQFLQLLTTDPWFAWLRPIAELIVQADERLADDRPIQMDQVESFATQVQQLLQQDLGDPQFRDEYRRSLQELPDVVIAHARVMSLLSEQ